MSVSKIYAEIAVKMYSSISIQFYFSFLWYMCMKNKNRLHNYIHRMMKLIQSVKRI